MEVNATRDPFDVLRKREVKTRIWEEIQYHRDHREALAKKCLLRPDFLAEVRRAVEAPGGGALLLLGAPGWGKTSTLAWVSQQVCTGLPRATEALCLVGLTAESRNVRLVLQSLCVQLAEAFAPPQTRLSTGLPQLVNEFHALLAGGTAARPVVLVLDGLDELWEERPADLSWLERPLPRHVRLLMSAAADSACAAALQKSPHTTVLSIPPLGLPDIEAALERGLRASGRRLRGDQWKLLLAACESCPCPLYLEAALWESRLWTSYCGGPPAGLAADLGGLYLGLLARLEREHGPCLVRRVATLIAVSRGGCTEEELLDLLAKDKKVIQEVALSHSSASSHSRVPYILWARLKRDLGPHLTEVKTEGTWVYRWTHSALGRTCAKRYLKTEESRKAVHADYADYFGEDSKRASTIQPLVWVREAGNEDDEDDDDDDNNKGEGAAKSYVFNLRKLHGLPYHLVRSGQTVPFMTECVFSYEFLLHKVQGLSILDVEEDLENAVLPDKVVPDVEVLAGALALSRTILEDDPCQLASQIMGRLGKILAEDRPVAPGDPLKFSYLHTLLSQCAHSSLPVLVPSYTCLLPPGGLPHHLLAGHSSPVTALGGGLRSPVAVTCEADGNICLWDLELRRVVRTLGGAGGVAANHLTLGLDDSVLVVCTGHSLQVRDVETGRVLYSEDDLVDVPMVTTTCEGQLLVAFYDGSRLVKVFDLASSCSLLCCLHMDLEVQALHKDRSIVLSSSSFRDYVLFAYRSGVAAAVLSARGGKVSAVLSAQHAAAAIQAVDMTSQYLLLFCRYPYKRDGEMIHIELFSTASYLYLRSILCCGQDLISQVTVNRTGTHAVGFCPSSRTGVTEVVTWNLETEDHKHVVRFVGVLNSGQSRLAQEMLGYYTLNSNLKSGNVKIRSGYYQFVVLVALTCGPPAPPGLCRDLHYCVGFCGGERYLRLWDFSSRINDQSLTYNVHKPRSDGTQEIVPMSTTSPRYAVCRSMRAGSVSVWNLVRRRHAGRPVRVEHGLYGGTDVALAHDLKLYILTDRGTASATDTPAPVFQTLLVYDLVERTYLRRKTGLYVVPCPQQEYNLLEDGRILLGLSETRDHLILWDLESGYIQDRIKPSRKESFLSSGVPQEQQPPTTLTREKTMMPWDIRTESQASRRRRLEREARREREERCRIDREKYNAIDQYLLSGDRQVCPDVGALRGLGYLQLAVVVVCSYFAHHLNVFAVATRDHVHTLEDRTSQLSLRMAALTPAGGHLVLSNYSRTQRAAYLTLWDLRTGTVRKRLRNQPGVCCVALTDDASRVAFGVTESNKLKVWDPFKRKHKSISGYWELRLSGSSQLFMAGGGAKAFLLSDRISLWDLDSGSVLSVFSPDARIQCPTLLAGGGGLLLGLSQGPALIHLRLTSPDIATATRDTTTGREGDLFGESSSSEDEEPET
ncbi:NACHT domain- and WD repeat-containing protein 1 [Merluccius polli]|uniref:NACHT domain- and WD repeat-containing protein 1 n=1 Tax=Merluccius polli TaxID=89951 RepID=A0AA47M1B1_MERPO|nr:NACHT domain- and WD repeat-containing protein 1 [Merluccius polli]